MKHKVTFRTPNGVLQETMFDQFDEFCDSMDQVANQYYQGLQEPGDINVESVLDNGELRGEKVSFDGRTEYLSEQDEIDV
jgi:hypothetical protein